MRKLNCSWRVMLMAMMISISAPVAARVTRLEIESKQPYGSFVRGDYMMYAGRVFGELAPTEAIADIGKPLRNDRGFVEYSASVILFMPVDPSQGNGTLLVNAPNRGKAYSRAIYNSPRDEPYESGYLEAGTGFLEDRGFASAEVSWELGKGASLPSFIDEAGKKRFVEGVGFAIIRDTADFLARAAVDAAGHANPLHGAIKHVLASGKSQSGRYLKTFLLHGFNRVDGRRVFDGMHIFVTGSGLLPIMQSGTGPESSANGVPTFDNLEFPGVNDGPLTIGELIDQVKARGEVPPKMLIFNTHTDYLSIRASLARTGAEGTAERTIPDNVRVYDIAGAPHNRVAEARQCKLTPEPLDWTPVSRAALLRLDAWVRNDTEPPPNRLMMLEPAIGDPNVLQAPKYLPKAVIQQPKRDPDGNALGGIRLPDLEVPLGTHGLQNEPRSRGCMMLGAYVPFARTKKEREAANDSRPSLEERYGNREDYVNRVRVAARKLERDGFLLAEDAAIIIQSAASSSAFK